MNIWNFEVYVAVHLIGSICWNVYNEIGDSLDSKQTEYDELI